MIAVSLVGVSCVFCVGFAALVLWATSASLTKLSEALPTVPPTPDLIEGNEYWLGGIELGPIRDYWIDLYSLPEHGADSTIVAVVSDSSQMRLVKKQGGWCYIEVVDEYFRDATFSNDETEEGWVKCSCLLGHQPTPLPTPVLTPQRPSD